MVQSRTVVKVIDNTGVTFVRCISVLRGPRAMGSTGHTIVASVRDTKGVSKIQKGDVVRALIVRSKNEKARYDGSWFIPGESACVLVNATGNPIGTRIKGLVSKTLLKNRDNLKILTLATQSV
ncbi:hypothetical protein NDN08_007766 [Rhodosorus marinus]|uniref:50S ribosomal protein L14, chloroplastic n=1 Tax=Rhodosorus marinus TaxID=101924 RepID=A0AAV8V2P7_9RHOD|nr:hypothetical protein NDN08_007766 [Rhodosorus marinus]